MFQLFTFVKILFMRERVLEFLKRENKSSAQFAEEIGVQPSGISHILSGRNNPSLDFVLKMLEKYKYLSTEWLLFGKGDMYRDSAMRNLFELNNEPSLPPKETAGTEKAVSEPLDSNDNQVTDQELPSREQKIEKIVWFFKNNTFREFFPER